MLHDLVLTISLRTGAVIAICGLNTWRSQLEGGAHFEAAAFDVGCIPRTRHSTMSSSRSCLRGTGRSPPSWSRRSTRDGRDSPICLWIPCGYTARWQRCGGEIRYDLELLAAEVLWASELKAASGKLEALSFVKLTGPIQLPQFRGHLQFPSGPVEFDRIREFVFRRPEAIGFLNLIDAVSGFEEILRSRWSREQDPTCSSSVGINLSRRPPGTPLSAAGRRDRHRGGDSSTRSGYLVLKQARYIT